MKIRRWITAIVLLLLLAAAIVGVVQTRELPAPNEDAAATPGKKVAGKASAKRPLVDQRPLQTARRMATLAGTPEEQVFAHEAEKVGDHEVDLAFFDALRTAEENPPPLSPEAKQIADRKAKAAQTVKDDQENIALLTRKLAAAPESQKDNLQDQIDVAKAQIDLDQDELDDAAEDLEQAGGDPQSKIKRLQAEHEAGDHNVAAAGSAVNPHEQDYQAHTLLNVFRAWQALREKRAELEAARTETVTKQQRLSQRHETLTAQVEKEKENREAAKQQAKGFAKSSQAASRDESKAAAKRALDSLKQYTRDQKNLADLGRRVQDEQDLSDIYSNWIALVETRERAALHNLIESSLWILLVLVAVYVANRLIEHLFTGMAAENKRIDTLRAVVQFGAEAVGAIAILFIIFGMPTQTTTVLGLAGAGLTVAMKDFIVAFFGWFVLMGRNGIRVGDWVEINGVGGEVVEVGLLKTVVLETGRWADAGHPTGRRVSFVNSFAIEGHFFNFTTSGQWMWDELQVLIPPSQDPYPLIDGIQKLVEKETAANASKAEAEWKQATAKYRVQALSAVPGISVVPTGAGIEVHVRYITRANERHEARKRLYEAVVEMMHGRREAVKA
ncbi:MAG TPA: mechanosensitive ion channel domain-containing protein [Candidatus Sulfotelmatobacter sp.]|jgi:small-conductance mechanosensitive channel|nr:mechanosensitive ion channel domain-containing protein [Candidatus Sulfotelmatobacter sp.]